MWTYSVDILILNEVFGLISSTDISLYLSLIQSKLSVLDLYPSISNMLPDTKTQVLEWIDKFSVDRGFNWNQFPKDKQIYMYKLELVMQKNQLMRDNQIINLALQKNPFGILSSRP